MNFEETLLENRSKSFIVTIADYIGDDKVKFARLMKLALSQDPILAPRASWAAIHTADQKQKLLAPWLGKMIQHLSITTNHSVKRNILRLLENVRIPQKYQAQLVDLSYGFMLSSKEPIAVKVFAMTVVANITQQHPDLKNELKMVVEQLMANEPQPAIISRGKRTLKLLAKL